MHCEIILGIVPGIPVTAGKKKLNRFSVSYTGLGVVHEALYDYLCVIDDKYFFYKPEMK